MDIALPESACAECPFPRLVQDGFDLLNRVSPAHGELTLAVVRCDRREPPDGTGAHGQG